MISRDSERDILPMARHFGMALAPWDAIGGGRLQSKAQLEEKTANGEGIRAMIGGAEQTEEEEKYSLVLDEIAKEVGLKGPASVALAYLLCKAPYVFPLIGGRKVEVSHISPIPLSAHQSFHRYSLPPLSAPPYLRSTCTTTSPP